MHSPLLVLVVPVEEEVPLDEVGEEQSEFPDELDPVEPPPEPPLSFLLFPNIDSSTSPSIPSQFSALWMEIKSCVWSKCSKKPGHVVNHESNFRNVELTWISWSSVLPTIPPLPLVGPNTTWLYKGSFITGKPEIMFHQFKPNSIIFGKIIEIFP